MKESFELSHGSSYKIHLHVQQKYFGQYPQKLNKQLPRTATNVKVKIPPKFFMVKIFVNMRSREQIMGAAPITDHTNESLLTLRQQESHYLNAKTK